jgi:hypothetical protein
VTGAPDAPRRIQTQAVRLAKANKLAQRRILPQAKRMTRARKPQITTQNTVASDETDATTQLNLGTTAPTNDTNQDTPCKICRLQKGLSQQSPWLRQ